MRKLRITCPIKKEERWYKFENKTKGDKEKTYYASVSSSDYVDNSTETTHNSTAEMIDMDIAKQVINNIGGTDGI